MSEREVDRVGREPPGLVGERDALAVERVDRARGVADHEIGRPDPGRHRPAGRAAGRRSGRRSRSRARCPTGPGAVAQNASIRWRRVDVLPARERREQADPDVHRAVTNRKYPPISGQMVPIAVPDVEVALDPGVVVERAREIAADRHPERDTCGRGRCRAPGRSGSWRRRRRSRTGPGPARVVPVSLSCTIAPVTRPFSTSGSIASVAGHKVAPAFTAARRPSRRARGAARRSRTAGSRDGRARPARA